MGPILITIFIAVALCGAPVPSSPEGYLYNRVTDSKARLDIYEDVLCSDCKADHPTLMEWLESTGSDGTKISENVEVYFHFFPLPYHHHAFIATNALSLAWENTKDIKTVLNVADYFFDNINTYQGSGAKELT